MIESKRRRQIAETAGDIVLDCEERYAIKMQKTKKKSHLWNLRHVVWRCVVEGRAFCALFYAIDAFCVWRVMYIIDDLSRKKRVLSIALLGALANGCAWVDGEYGSAEFAYETAYEKVDGEQDLTCAVKHLPKSFKQFETDEPFDRCVRMMMYESVTRRTSENMLAITFVAVDGDTLASCPPIEDLVGQDGIAITANGCVRAMLTISRCSPVRTLRVVGDMSLSDYSSKRGKTVAGTLNGRIEFVEKIAQSDGTHRERVTDMGTISGEFSYQNRAGTVWNH